MRATGIIRRIDDLGRVVIPKEIRRSLKLREGDPMEFYVEDNKLILVPYIILQETVAEKARKYLETANIYNHNAVFTISGKTVVCNSSNGIGIANCGDKDEFNAEIGMAIAYMRSLGYSDNFIKDTLGME